MDQRFHKLAEVIIHHSCQLKNGEQVLIEAIDLPTSDLVLAILEVCHQAGVKPWLELKNTQVLRSWLMHADQSLIEDMAKHDSARMSQMDAYVGIRGAANSAELADLPDEQLELYQQNYVKPVHFEIRVPKTRWVVMRYPTPSMAQSANMSSSAFEDYFFRVCTADYQQMERNLAPLVEKMEQTSEVKLVAPGTELQFSIESIPVVPCYGRRNLPDGEVFTAPVKNSIQGQITYNVPSRYQGTVFNNIHLEFKDGQIIKAECDGDSRKLNSIFDTDEGARYIGEFSLGVNYEVQHPILDTLFDEKIGGSFHLTPGNAYETADNGNRSAVHWDLVQIQTPEYGGGEVWFDGELIRKDGLFVCEELKGLNPQT